MDILGVVALSFLLFCLHKLIKARQMVADLRRYFFEPPTKFIFGHTLDFYEKNLPEIFQIILNYSKNYGKNVLIWGVFYVSTAITSDPNDVEVILSNSNSRTAKKSIEYYYLTPWLATGLLTSEGDKWFQRRKIITPSFHFSILERFVEVMDRQTRIFVKKLDDCVGKDSFDISNHATLFALDVICEASMGISVNAQNDPNSEYVLSVKEMTSIIFGRIFKFSHRLPGCFILTKSGRRHWILKRRLHKYTSNVIASRRKTIESESYKQEKKLNLMDMLLHTRVDGKPLSDEDIREEVDTFMFEGHDTTASGIAFTIYQLAKHQDIQDRVYEEVRAIYENDPNAEATFQNLTDMKYLEMVIKETLRLMPSVPFMGRQLTESCKMGDKIIPAGANIGISVYSMHHDPDNFPDPEKFDPERFDPNNPQVRHPFSYIPFSAGARNCIGQRFAMLEMKTVISKTLMHYRILPDDSEKDILLTAALILKSSNGVHVRLEKR